MNMVNFRHVLIVDDSLEDRQAVAAALRANPRVRHRFSEAATGADGLRQFADPSEPIDLLILDWRLPDMQAAEFVRSLPRQDNLPPVPIVLLTGSPDWHSTPELLELGVQDFFSKDALTPEILSRVAVNAIERHRLLCRLIASEREAEAARFQADKANRAKSQFLTAMSHELRTPLTAILGFTELLRGHPDSPDAPEMLEMMASSGEHLSELLDDLIDIAKVEAGTLEVELVACDIHQLVRNSCELMRLRASDNALSLDYTIDPSVPRGVCTDPVRYRQILTNLLGNAIKFTDSGGIRVEVTYDQLGDEGKLITRVSDTGSGIADEVIDVVFTPFVQASNRADRRRTGIGLGLAIARQLAEMLEGELVIESTSSAGTSFRFTVRADATDLGDDSEGCGTQETDRTEGDSAGCNPDWTGKRVLVVEDTRANQYLLRRLLEPTGVRVDQACDGQEAVESVQHSRATGLPYDLVLMDMQMPRLDGYSATSLLRSEGVDTPVVAITAAALTSDRQRCLDAGCNAVVTKPIDTSALLATLGRHLTNGQGVNGD